MKWTLDNAYRCQCDGLTCSFRNQELDHIESGMVPSVCQQSHGVLVLVWWHHLTHIEAVLDGNSTSLQGLHGHLQIIRRILLNGLSKYEEGRYVQYLVCMGYNYVRISSKLIEDQASISFTTFFTQGSGVACICTVHAVHM